MIAFLAKMSSERLSYLVKIGLWTGHENGRAVFQALLEMFSP